MKKNKTRNWYKATLRKSSIQLMAFNLAFYLFILFCFVMTITIGFNERFRKVVSDTIIEFENDVKTIANDATRFIGDSNIDDPRITAVYYYTDPKFVSQEQFLSPKIIGSIVKGSLGREDVTSIENIKSEDTGEIKNEKILGYNFRTYVANIRYKGIESATTQRDRTVCYVKIYLNVDGELSAKNQLTTIINITVIILLFLIYYASYCSMHFAVGKIQKSIDQQVQFISDASHELRTPIAVVTSQIENTLASPNKTVLDISEDVAASLNELYRLRKLVEELLSLARSDQNRLTYNYTSVNVKKVLEETVEQIGDLAAIKGCPIKFIGDECECYLDKDKLKELVIILLDNAVKYSNEGDKITVTLKDNPKDITIEVADTGIGISEETKQKIFERFYREDKARSRETGGNGLGLSIAKTIVTDMRGKISVDHNQPKGTKFDVVFKKIKEKKTDELIK